MRKILSVILAVLILLFSFSSLSFASDSDFSVSVLRSSYLDTSQIAAFAFSGSDVNNRHFDYIGTNSPNILSPTDKGAFLYIGNTSPRATSSDILYAFQLNKFMPWDSVNATFSVSGTINISEFGSYNRPEKFAVAVLTSSDWSKLLNNLLFEDGAKLTDDLPDLLSTLYNYPDSSAIKLLGFQQSTSPIFNFNVSTNNGSDTDPLLMLFVAYAGNHNNFMIYPQSVTLTPFGESLKQMREYKQRQELINQGQTQIEQNSEIISGIGDIQSILNGEGESYSTVDKSEIDEYESLESSLIKDLQSDLAEAFTFSNDVFINNGSFAFIRSLFEDTILSNSAVLSLIFFCLSMGIVALILGRKVGSG